MTEPNTSNPEQNTNPENDQTNDRAAKIQRPGDVADANETVDTSTDPANTGTGSDTDQQ